jgi:hypothetical protein
MRYPKQVIFPSGLVFDNGEWIVAAGYNDRRIVLFRLSHAQLERSLADVSVQSADKGFPPTAMLQPNGAHRPLHRRIRRAIR